MEIERKFTIKHLPEDLDSYPFHQIEQAYLNTDPVVRIRKENENYYLTYKGKGLLAREEHNLPLNKDSYYHLREKADGIIISKRRYLIPLKNPRFIHTAPDVPQDYTLTIELDIFEGSLAPLVLAEVEFGSKAAAENFLPPDWFDQDVTYDRAYHNATLSRMEL